jgi:predicted ABC-type ATPase
MQPNVYIIAGSNGAGKTTFAREFLPKFADCKNFINADLLAQGMSPFSPDSAAARAGRLMFSEIEHFASRGIDFAFETTLSGRTHLNLIDELKKRQYEIHFFYLWVPSAEIALSRVRDRVSAGGHDIPETVIRRRFDRSIRNFFTLYRELAESWTLFNNSGKSPRIVAFEKKGKLRKIDVELFDRLIGLYGIK